VEHGDIEPVTVEATLRQTTSRYTGVPIREIIARADPKADEGLVLIEASDGYAFFVTLEEVEENESLVLAVRGRGDEASYHVVGAESSKAWVRNVTQMTVITAAPLPIEGSLDKPAPYQPAAWQNEMDSTQINLGDGAGGRKLQGAPLGEVLASMEPQDAAETVIVTGPDTAVTLPLSEVLADDGVRIFTVINEAAINYAVARMDGEVLVYPVTTIEVQ
jgi:DMSO/TMAO reductase YedYZ molybdopterin-dependent catalytic subunit